MRKTPISSGGCINTHDRNVSTAKAVATTQATAEPRQSPQRTRAWITTAPTNSSRLEYGLPGIKTARSNSAVRAARPTMSLRAGHLFIGLAVMERA